jgi:outer membrane protein assembly factor BamB
MLGALATIIVCRDRYDAVPARIGRERYLYHVGPECCGAEVSMKKYILRVLFLLMLTGCGPAFTPPTLTAVPALTATPPPSPTSAPEAGVILHQNDPQRTGLYDFAALRGPVSALWQAELSGRVFGAPMFVAGLLYVCGFNTVYVFDAQTGEQMEPIRGVGAPFSPLAVAGDLLIGGDATEKLLAYDRNSRQQAWVFDTDGAIYNAPLIIGEIVYAVSERGAYALDLQTGEVIWQVATGDHRGFVGHPAYENGTLFVGVGSTYYALDGVTGEIRWQAERAPDQWFYSSALANGRVYVGHDDGYFYALDQQSGAVVWKSQQVGPGWSAPAISGGVVYVGSRDQHIYAFDALTGQQRWRFETVDWAVSDPLISNGVVYVGVGNHENKEGPRPLYALDAMTGQELWQFEADARLMTAATLGPEAVYVVSVTGTVYALR